MRFIPLERSTGRAIAGISGGVLMICNVIVGYTYMRIVFFGAPHFTWSTPQGRSEINYAISSLLMIGFGLFFLYLGLRAWRRHL